MEEEGGRWRCEVEEEGGRWRCEVEKGGGGGGVRWRRKEGVEV